MKTTQTMMPDTGKKAGAKRLLQISTTLQSEVRTVMEGRITRGDHHRRETAGSRLQRPVSFRGMALMAVLAVFLTGSLIIAGFASAATAGPNSAASAVNNAATGTVAWTNTGNALVSDNSYASVNLGSGEYSNYLVATGFNFSIPAGSTINGIEAIIEKREAGLNYYAKIKDYNVRLVKNGLISGSNKAITDSYWPTADTMISYGSGTDLWGQTWTAENINASNFGVAIAVQGITWFGTRNDAQIDNITITVYYTAGGPTCTINAPLVEILEAPKTITSDNGSVNYNVRITNQDVGAGCTNPLTVNLSRSDSNGAFTSSVPASVNLAPGANTTVVLQVTEVSASSGQSTTTTVTAAAASHPNGSANVVTTYTPAPTCTTNTPSLSVSPAIRSVTAGDSVAYTVTVTNNDSAACSAVVFMLSVVSDSNGTDFTVPSLLSLTSINLLPAESGISTLTVSAKATAAEGAVNNTTVRVTAVSHTTPPDATVKTTVGNPLLHNSLTTESTKWGADGGWGIPGGKYGEFICKTCHTPDTTNIKRVKETITVTDPASPDVFPGSAVNFKSTTAPNGFGDDTGGHTTSMKVCEVCHSQNKYHNYNTANNTGGLDHNNNTDCAACHLHSEGFKASCSACHGDPPPPLAGQGGSTPTGSLEPGAHIFHATTQGYPCATCHQNSVGTGITHNNTIISIGFNIFSGAYASGSYDGQLTANYQATNAGTTVSKNGNLTCSAIYCHGSTMAPNNGSDTTPEWNNPATAVCGTCHGATAAQPPVRGMHVKHAGEWNGTVTWGRELACSFCHKDPAVDKSLHVNNMSEVIFTADPRVAGGIYSGTPAMLDAYGSCSGVYCHSNVQTSPPGGPVTYVSVNWGDPQSFSCNVCHQGPATHTTNPMSGNLTGSHVKHASYNRFGCVTCHTNNVAFNPTDPVNGGLDCDGCHAATDVNTSHTNYAIDVAFVNIYGGSYSGNPMPGDAYGNCSSTYCHSTGVSVRTGSVPANTTPNWGSGPLACNACHGNTMYPSPNDGMPNYANGTPKENSHAAHVINNTISCQNCHNGTTTNGTTIASTALHVNRKYDAQASGTFAGQPIAFTYVPASTGSPGSCNSISCHGNNSATWGGDPLKCSDCHFGASDTDDFTYGNGITARISSTEWSYSGHGKTSGTYDVSMNPAANLPGAAGTGDPCLYCHSTTVGHNVMTNPFRLANNNIGGNGWNDTCLACHRTGSAGYDPDGAGPMASKNATKKINKYHYGAKHGPTNDGGSLCIDCHEPHGDRSAGGGNIFMIHSAVTKDKIDEYGRPAATASPVFTANTTGTDYAKTASPFNGICNVCHTTTNHYRSNFGDGHNIGSKCTTCHAHSKDSVVDGEAFAASGECNECHATPQGPRRAVINEFVGTNPATNIGHLAYDVKTPNNNAQLEADCGECHTEPVANHMDGVLNNPIAGTTFNTPGYCLSCHDADGANGDTTPFTDNVIVPNVNTQWVKTANHNKIEGCYACHGDGVGNDRVHGGAVMNLLDTGVTPNNPPAGSARTFTGPAQIASPDEQYKICYKCHSSWSTGSTKNVDRAFNTNNDSFHWVEKDKYTYMVNTGTGKGIWQNAEFNLNAVPGQGTRKYVEVMMPRSGFTYTNANLRTLSLRCSDCHGANNADGGINVPEGPHGSTMAKILKVPAGSPYTSWSSSTLYKNNNAWCLNCHTPTFNNTGMRGNGKNLHVQEHGEKKAGEGGACQDCHLANPHGQTGSDTTNQRKHLLNPSIFREGVDSERSGDYNQHRSGGGRGGWSNDSWVIPGCT